MHLLTVLIVPQIALRVQVVQSVHVVLTAIDQRLLAELNLRRRQQVLSLGTPTTATIDLVKDLAQHDSIVFRPT